MTNLIIDQGTTWAMMWPIVDTDGNPIDVTGWTVQAQIRPSVTSNEVYHEWTTEAGNATTEQGAVVLSVSAPESTGWNWRSAVYDVELTDPQGRVARIAEGNVTVSAEVTR